MSPYSCTPWRKDPMWFDPTCSPILRCTAPDLTRGWRALVRFRNSCRLGDKMVLLEMEEHTFTELDSLVDWQACMRRTHSLTTETSLYSPNSTGVESHTGSILEVFVIPLIVLKHDQVH